jgi:hypothetical protein
MVTASRSSSAAVGRRSPAGASRATQGDHRVRSSSAKAASSRQLSFQENRLIFRIGWHHVTRLVDGQFPDISR